jgi:hypothetical protein
MFGSALTMAALVFMVLEYVESFGFYKQFLLFALLAAYTVLYGFI